MTDIFNGYNPDYKKNQLYDVNSYEDRIVIVEELKTIIDHYSVYLVNINNTIEISLKNKFKLNKQNKN
jgi:hypothetical protein